MPCMLMTADATTSCSAEIGDHFGDHTIGVVLLFNRTLTGMPLRRQTLERLPYSQVMQKDAKVPELAFPERGNTDRAADRTRRDPPHFE